MPTGPGGDDLKYLRPGQPVYTAPKAFYNRLIDLSRAERDGRYNGGGIGPLGGHGVMTVVVRNTTGALVPAFGVLELSGLVSEPAAGDPFPPLPPEAFNGAAPAAAGNAFCITLDALGADEACLGATAGIVPAMITGEGALAGPRPGDTGILQAGTAGVPIVWAEEGTGARWAYVLLGGKGVVVQTYTESSGVPLANQPIGTFRLRVGDFAGQYGLRVTMNPGSMRDAAEVELDYAAYNAEGVVSKLNQTFSGVKTFDDGVNITGTLGWPRLSFGAGHGMGPPGGSNPNPFFGMYRTPGNGYVGGFIGTEQANTAGSPARIIFKSLKGPSDGAAPVPALELHSSAGLQASGRTVDVALSGVTLNFLSGLLVNTSGAPPAGATGSGGWVTVEDGIVTDVSETIDGGGF